MTDTDIVWEQALPELLEELSSVQQDWLAVLVDKQQLLLNPTAETSLRELQSREQELLARLQACHEQRERLLARAEQQGKPHENLRLLTAALPEGAARQTIQGKLDSAQQQLLLLRQRNLSNWVLHQRSLIHLSQMLEIIATGGRLQPTYEKEGGGQGAPTGVLVDEEV